MTTAGIHAILFVDVPCVVYITKNYYASPVSLLRDQVRFWGQYARVAELVDAKDLKSSLPGCTGGSKNVDFKPNL